MSSGHDTGYLTNAVAGGREGYYTNAVAAGEPAGLWHGAGAERLGLAGEIDADLMRSVYRELRDPRTVGATIGAPHRVYRSAEEIYADMVAATPHAGPEERATMRANAEKSARQAVAFIDATFSAPKSVTVLAVAAERAENDARAAGDLQAARVWAAHREAIEAAVMAGATAAVDYLQDVAGYARVGHHGGAGGRWVDAHEWVVGQFLQHDSRTRDPQLHVHQAILNRQLCADGQWRALDGKALYTHRGAAAAVGERAMEAYLARTLGVRMEPRPDGHGQEVVGVPAAVMELFSSRRREVSRRAGELLDRFPGAVRPGGLAAGAHPARAAGDPRDEGGEDPRR